MADRIVLMDKGRIAQVGSPEEVYDRPVSAFVASFMGAENRIALTIHADSDVVRIAPDPGGAAVPCPGTDLRGAVTGYFRDDDVGLADPDADTDGALVLQGAVASRAYLGGLYRYSVACGESCYTATAPQMLEPGERVGLRLPLQKLHLFSSEHQSNQ